MEAKELIDIIQPEHGRSSCSDEDVQNGFWSRYGYNDKGNWHGRCIRCMLLEVINNHEDVPKGEDLSNIFN